MRFGNFIWEPFILGNLFRPIRNGFVGIATPFYTDENNGIRYLQSTNIHDGQIGDGTRVYVTKDFHQKHSKSQLVETDILMVQSGHSGECAVVGPKYAGCNCHALIIMSSLGTSDSRFIAYLLNGPIGKKKTEFLLTGNTVKHILASDVKGISIMAPPLIEQRKIADFLSLIDRRIAVQNKIIEDLVSVEKLIIDNVFCQQTTDSLAAFIDEISERNRIDEPFDVYSVSNKLGFIPQSEQFEDKEVASDNKQNYKIVTPSTFAYNPARINVGSIGFYSGENPVIVSPMYVCFKVRGIEPLILKQFFLSKAFYKEMSSKLEGSVRQCLTFQGMRSIRMHVPDDKDEELLALAQIIREKRAIETHIRDDYMRQKQYLLTSMFI